MKNLYLRGSVYYMKFRYQGIYVHKSTGTDQEELAQKAVEAEKYRIYNELVDPHAIASKKASKAMNLHDAIQNTYSNRWALNRSGSLSYQQAQVILGVLGSVPVNSIDVSMLRELQRKLRKTLNSETTVNRYLAALRTVMNYAAKEDSTIRVPRFELTREKTGRIIVFSREQEQKILQYYKDREQDEMHDLVIVLIDTGLRLMEALNIHKRVQGQLVSEYRDGAIRCWRTKSGVRTVLTTKRVSDILQRRYQFSLTKRMAQRRWEYMAKAVGLESGSVLHCLRHTCASRLLAGTETQKGISLRELQEWLGHSEITTTQRYLHCVPDAKGKAIEILQQE